MDYKYFINRHVICYTVNYELNYKFLFALGTDKVHFLGRILRPAL